VVQPQNYTFRTVLFIVKVAFIECVIGLSLLIDCLKLNAFGDCRNASKSFSKLLFFPNPVGGFRTVSDEFCTDRLLGRKGK